MLTVTGRTVEAVSQVVKVEPLTTARALRGPFDYLRPDGADVGSVLDVPFGHQKLRGVVVGLASESPHTLVAPRRVLDGHDRPQLVELALWMAAEYCSTPARALGLVLPPRRRARAQRAARARPPGRRRASGSPTPSARCSATLPRAGGRRPRRAAAPRGARARGDRAGAPAPRAAARAGRGAGRDARRSPPAQARRGRGDRRGGAGRAAAAARRHRLGQDRGLPARRRRRRSRAGASVIVLVPEIALTPQTVVALRGALRRHRRGAALARCRRASATTSGGACAAARRGSASARARRSSRRSTTRADRRRRGARRLLQARGRPALRRPPASPSAAPRATRVLLAGSATPRPESVHALRRLRLPERVDGAPLPPVELLDMRGDARHAAPATRSGRSAMRARRSCCSTAAAGRTSSPAGPAGRSGSARSCDVALVLHRAEGAIACHHCGHREPVPAALRRCGSVSVARHGAGTERLEDELAERSACAVFRLDADTAADAGRVLRARFERRRPRRAGRHADGRQGPRLPRRRRSASCSTPTRRCASPTSAPRSARSRWSPSSPGARAAGRAAGACSCRRSRPTRRRSSPPRATTPTASCASELERRRGAALPAVRDADPGRLLGRGRRRARAAAAAATIRDALGRPTRSGPAPLFRLRGRERSQVVVKTPSARRAIAAVGAAVDAPRAPSAAASLQRRRRPAVDSARDGR